MRCHRLARIRLTCRRPVQWGARGAAGAHRRLRADAEHSSGDRPRCPCSSAGHPSHAGAGHHAGTRAHGRRRTDDGRGAAARHHPGAASGTGADSTPAPAPVPAARGNDTPSPAASASASGANATDSASAFGARQTTAGPGPAGTGDNSPPPMPAAAPGTTIADGVTPAVTERARTSSTPASRSAADQAPSSSAAASTASPTAANLANVVAGLRAFDLTSANSVANISSFGPTAAPPVSAARAVAAARKHSSKPTPAGNGRGHDAARSVRTVSRTRAVQGLLPPRAACRRVCGAFSSSSSWRPSARSFAAVVSGQSWPDRSASSPFCSGPAEPPSGCSQQAPCAASTRGADGRSEGREHDHQPVCPRQQGNINHNDRGPRGHGGAGRPLDSGPRGRRADEAGARPGNWDGREPQCASPRRAARASAPRLRPGAARRRWTLRSTDGGGRPPDAGRPSGYRRRHRRPAYAQGAGTLASRHRADAASPASRAQSQPRTARRPHAAARLPRHQLVRPTSGRGARRPGHAPAQARRDLPTSLSGSCPGHDPSGVATDRRADRPWERRRKQRRDAERQRERGSAGVGDGRCSQGAAVAPADRTPGDRLRHRRVGRRRRRGPRIGGRHRGDVRALQLEAGRDRARPRESDRRSSVRHSATRCSRSPTGRPTAWLSATCSA